VEICFANQNIYTRTSDREGKKGQGGMATRFSLILLAINRVAVSLYISKNGKFAPIRKHLVEMLRSFAKGGRKEISLNGKKGYLELYSVAFYYPKEF